MTLSIEIVLTIDEYADFVNSALFTKMQQATQGLQDPPGGVFRVAYSTEQPQTQLFYTFQLPGLLFIDLDRSVVVGKASIGNLSTLQLRSLIEQYLNLEYDPETGTYLNIEDGSIVPIQEAGNNFIPGFGLFNINLPSFAWLIIAGFGGYKAYTSKKQLIQTIGAAGAIVGINQYLKDNTNKPGIGLIFNSKVKNSVKCANGKYSTSIGKGTCSYNGGIYYKNTITTDKKALEAPSSKRLNILKSSLAKKEQQFKDKLQNHFNTVKQSHGQPLNDKRDGARTLRKWEKQNESLLNLQKSIEKTKNAINKEEGKIKDVEFANTFIPAEIQKLVKTGELIQWRKYPHIFFVNGVDKARIIWDNKKKVVAYKYFGQIKDNSSSTAKEQKSKFARIYNKLNAVLNK